MYSLQHTVMVPHKSKKFFQGDILLNLSYIYYRPGYETPFQKGMRKIGLRDVHQTLDAKFRIVEGVDLLEKTYALWLTPELILSSAQMECLLDRLPGLKWLYSHMAGTDHLDLEMFEKRGIMVSNNGDFSSRRVAEMVLACIFAHAKRLQKHFAIQRKRKWQSLPCDDLHRQTVGIIGTGNIGREVAMLCRAIGMRVVGASRNPRRFDDDPSPYHRIVQLDGGLDSLLAESDHVVVALALNGQTRSLIGWNELNRMKRNSSLINISRSAIVDEIALCKALTEGRVGGAYIDPPSSMSRSIFSRTYRTPNLIFTHNSAANNPHAQEEACRKFLSGIKEMLDTGQPPNRVA
jgi:phosphoglycerate dehydrogenase-like enzyme